MGVQARRNKCLCGVRVLAERKRAHVCTYLLCVLCVLVLCACAHARTCMLAHKHSSVGREHEAVARRLYGLGKHEAVARRLNGLGKHEPLACLQKPTLQGHLR